MPFYKSRLYFSKLPSRLIDDTTKKCGMRHTIFSPNGDNYTGEWQENKKHGSGIQVWKKAGAMYEGEWKFGKRDGDGTYSILQPGTKAYEKKYCGKWKNGRKHGHGVYFFSSASIYEGDWSEGQRSGWGVMLYENGDMYVGEWKRDKSHGQGLIIFANRNWYEGTWEDGKKHGKGKFYYYDKGQVYEGCWEEGVAKCGVLSDFGPDEAPSPTKYPIPRSAYIWSIESGFEGLPKGTGPGASDGGSAE